MVRLLQVTGFLLIALGFIGGLIASEIEDIYGNIERSIPILVLSIAGGLFTGLILVALGEILATLRDVKEK